MAITTFGRILEFSEKLEGLDPVFQEVGTLFSLLMTLKILHRNQTKGVQAFSKFSSTRKVGEQVKYILT